MPKRKAAPDATVDSRGRLLIGDSMTSRFAALSADERWALLALIARLLARDWRVIKGRREPWKKALWRQLER